MKAILKFTCTLTLLFCFVAISFPQSTTSADKSSKLWSSTELEDLTSYLISKYKETNPDRNISVEFADNDKLEEIISGGQSLVIASSKALPDVNPESWKMLLGRDVIVAVMNSSNPYINDIEESGLTSEDFAKIFTEGKTGKVQLLKNGKIFQITAWLPVDKSMLGYVADFTEADIESLNAQWAESSDEMLSEIIKDKNAIGFCRLVDLPAYEKGSQIRFVSIDVNGNNNIDGFEKIYSSTEEFSRGVWIGKYPKSLYGRIYAIAGVFPTGDELAFLEWMLSDGQQYLAMNGLSELTYTEKQSGMKNLAAAPVVAISDNSGTSMGMTAFLTVASILLCSVLVLFFILGFFRRGIPEEELSVKGLKKVFRENNIHSPGGIFFDRSHTWAFMEQDGRVKTGIDDFLPHVTGRINKIKMKKTGEKVVKGENFLTIIQDGKQLNILSPISGTIRETNPLLHSDPSVITNSPLEDGWVYKIETANWVKNIRNYLIGDDYREWLKTEFVRLKDFFAHAINDKNTLSLQPVMQDGGEIKEGVLEACGPEIWEEFQNGFIDRKNVV
jgi:glycine cleavage system H lipoate-binding protein/ABC-type phosphate transport system substrate-binding protein